MEFNMLFVSSPRPNFPAPVSHLNAFQSTGTTKLESLEAKRIDIVHNLFDTEQPWMGSHPH